MKTPSRGYGEGSEHAGWPFGDSFRSHDDLAAHLHQVGQRHARRALKLYTSTDQFEMLDAAFSVGSAVELLAKSLLASVSPTLLLSEPLDVGSILKFSGAKAPGFGRPDAVTVKSIDAGKCIDRLKQLKMSPPWLATDKAVFWLRNGSAHMGVVDQNTLRSAMRPMVRFAEFVREHYDHPSDRWWGPELDELARGIAQAEATQWDEIVQAKIAAAKLRLKELQQSLPAFSTETILKSMSGRSHTSVEHDEDQDCPACGYTGKAIGVILEYGVDADHYDGGVTYYSRMGVTHFECSVCNLELTDELEVSAAGLPTEIDYVDEDYEPAPWPE
ncbi:hypothetical protein LFT45_04305 [Arthrobacter sp. FW305-BF8]|uniref:hypothetical protein n=1 Tax=Arthrobacter sp. FW305-BF8 TaxID=2879617 RepID=UPI001F24B574|nr:hypothetical protein [Arthrobacter sp. FW305-BF8]UKA55164.1 hypothetical protein LFT45_04305 [Arthrobacter sp. FW305-BF8]